MSQENQISLLERIRNGERIFGPEYESQLDELAENGEIVIIQKHRESMTGNREVDRIRVGPIE